MKVITVNGLLYAEIEVKMAEAFSSFWYLAYGVSRELFTTIIISSSTITTTWQQPFQYPAPQSDGFSDFGEYNLVGY